jgi:hypothetical protein
MKAERRVILEEAAASLNIKIRYYAKIKPGDLYLGLRNTPPELLTCKKVVKDFIVSEEGAYQYDISQCVKVERKCLQIV